MYWVKTPKFIQSLFPSLVWNIKQEEKVIYLTFDDGPDEAITPQVLDLLKEFRANATFFCVGEKVVQNRELFLRIQKEGHHVGNHTFHHLNGWHTPTSEYIQNVRLADREIQSSWFRPPYGKIKPGQFKALKKKYRIILWDVMPGDFDSEISGEAILQRTIRNAKSGSIIVFHDNAKFADKMMFALRGTLQHFSSEGYRFKAIPTTPD